MKTVRRKSAQVPATSQDVARIAGVSRSAVSRVFTKGASASDLTRKRVLAAAKTLRYRPNLIARSLRTRRSNIIGLAISDLDNQYYPPVVQNFSEELTKLGFRLLLFITHGSAGPEPLLNELVEHRLDALILASTTRSSRLAEDCHRAGIPVVMFNNVDPNSGLASVSTANVIGARTVAAFLAAAGHTQFGYIAGLESDSTNAERERGFRTFLSESGLPKPSCADGGNGFAGAASAMRSLLKQKRRPDAVFCANDHMAFAGLQVAQTEFGLEPGRDISIVGFDNVPIAAWPQFALTTYSQPVEKLVTRTIVLIQELLGQDSPFQSRQERLRGDLIVRQSARRPTQGLLTDYRKDLVWTPFSD